MLHRDVVDQNLHVIGYIQDADPGGIGAGKAWVDTSGGTGNWILRIRNEDNDGWEAGGFGAGAHTHQYDDHMRESVTNGDSINPELVFANGDIVTVDFIEERTTSYG